MSYLSLSFAFFVIVSLFAYWVLLKRVRWVLLLAASLYFYISFDIKYLPFLLFCALSTYAGALALQRGGQKKLILGCVIGFNIAVWFVAKDLNWLFSLYGRIANVSAPSLNILVPVGISYFTLQAIGYLVDAYRGKIAAEKNFFKYLLFLSWFPAIVQGPISRYDRLMPQLLHAEGFSYERSRNGLLLVLIGLVKKMVIADRLNIFVNACFETSAETYGVLLYLGAVAYAFQLYTDFSGCVDICRGVSSLFGVDLVHNFSRPYLARSIKEFWGRWHLSLSSWLKDYIYIPLGGNRRSNVRKYVNLMSTFLVSGLWHGAGFTFLIWGGMHASYQIFGQITESLRKKIRKLMRIEEGSFSECLYQRLITFHLVTLAWIPFRASSVRRTLRYIYNMFSKPSLWVLFDGTILNYGLSRNHIALLLIHLAILMAIELLFKRQEDFIAGLTKQHFIVRWGIYFILLFDVLLFGVYGGGYDMAGFMYGGF